MAKSNLMAKDNSKAKDNLMEKSNSQVRDNSQVKRMTSLKIVILNKSITTKLKPLLKSQHHQPNHNHHSNIFQPFNNCWPFLNNNV